MRRTIILMALLLSAADAQAAIPAGVYSDVCVDSETGDLDGVELQIADTDGTPAVSLETCEGGCWQQLTRGIVMNGNQISFSAADQDFDGAGKLAHTTVRQFTATMRGAVLILDSPTYSPRFQRLQKQPVSASFRKSSGQPSPVRRCHSIR